MLILGQKTDHLQTFKDGLSLIVHPVLLAIDVPNKSIRWIAENTADRAELLEQNNKLAAEALLLKARLQKFAAIEKENTRLHNLLESSYKIGEQFISASLIDVNLSANTRHIIIDKGHRFNLFEGQSVINEDGVIGQIIEVHPLSSRILLITDPNHAISVEINRTGLRTIATGSGALNMVNLPYLPHNTDIKPGDLLITSGLGGVFPMGYPVARVSKLTPSPGEAFMRAEATTIAKIDKTREVLLVWSNQQPVPLLPSEPTTPQQNTNDAR